MRNFLFENVFLALPKCQDASKWFRGYNARFLEKTLTELKSRWKEFDHFIFHIAQPGWGKAFFPDERDRKRHILFYLGDEIGQMPEDAMGRYLAVFRQYRDKKSAAGNEFAFRLGVTPCLEGRTIPDMGSRKIDVFYSGNLNANRMELYCYFAGYPWFRSGFLAKRIMARLLRKRMPKDFSKKYPNSIISFTGGFQQGYGQEEYIDLLADSKLAICPKGYVSSETIRHYEALNAGCVVITRESPPNGLFDAAPVLEVRHWKELDTLVPSLLRDTDRLERLHEKGKAWWENVCEEKVVAAYVREKIEMASKGL